MANLQPKASEILSSLRLRVVYLAGGEIHGKPILCIPASARTAILGMDTAELKKLFTFLVWAGCNGIVQKKQVKYTVVASLRDAEWTQMRPYLSKLEAALPPDVEAVYVLSPQQKVSLTKLSFKAQLPEFAMRVVPIGMKALLTHVPGSQLTEEFGGTLPYSHDDWVDLILIHENTVKTGTRDLEVVNELSQDISSSVVCRDSVRGIEAARNQFQIQVGACLQTAARSQSQLKALADDLLRTPCPYRLCTTTSFFTGLVASVDELLIYMDVGIQKLELQWQGKVEEYEQAIVVLGYTQSIVKCSAGLAGHLTRLHARCADVGESFSSACGLLAQHLKSIESAQVDLLTMRSVLDKQESMAVLDGRKHADSIAKRCNLLTTAADNLARDLARRHLQLEKAKSLHSLVHEAERLCDAGYRLLATQSIDSCLTEDGSGDAIGDIMSLASQVVDIPIEQMVTVAKEMPLDSSLARNMGKMVTRRDDLVVLLKTRSDSLSRLLITHNLMLDQMKVRVENDVMSLCSMGSLDHHADSGHGESAAPSTADELSPSHVADTDWDLDTASTVSALPSLPLDRRPRRSTSSTLSLRRASPAGGFAPGKANSATGLYSSESLPARLDSPKSSSLGSEEILEDEETDAGVLEKRRCIARELITTERIYIDDIRDIVDTYWSAMDTATNPKVPPFLAGKQSIAFCNLPHLLDFHENSFLAELEECMDNPLLLGMCFAENCRQFQMYVPYCKNKHRSDTLFDEYEGSFFEELRIKRGHRLSLRDYLIKPVQRITKYQLLLKDMLKNCAKANGARKSLQSALDAMLEILQQANDAMHSSGILGFPGSLLEQGHVHMQDTFQVIPSTSMLKVLQRTSPERERQVFFYEQVLIITKRQVQRLGESRAFYSYKDHIKLSEVALTENVSRDKCRFQVAQHRGSKSFILHAKSMDVKKVWVTRIRQSLEEQLRNMQNQQQHQEVGMTWTDPAARSSSALSSEYNFSSKHHSLPHTLTSSDFYSPDLAYGSVQRIPRQRSPSPCRTGAHRSHSSSPSPFSQDRTALSESSSHKFTRLAIPQVGQQGQHTRGRPERASSPNLSATAGLKQYSPANRFYSISAKDGRALQCQSPCSEKSSGASPSPETSRRNSVFRTTSQPSLNDSSSPRSLRRSNSQLTVTAPTPAASSNPPARSVIPRTPPTIRRRERAKKTKSLNLSLMFLNMESQPSNTWTAAPSSGSSLKPLRAKAFHSSFDSLPGGPLPVSRMQIDVQEPTPLLQTRSFDFPDSSSTVSRLPPMQRLVYNPRASGELTAKQAFQTRSRTKYTEHDL